MAWVGVVAFRMSRSWPRGSTDRDGLGAWTRVGGCGEPSARGDPPSGVGNGGQRWAMLRLGVVNGQGIDVKSRDLGIGEDVIHGFAGR